MKVTVRMYAEFLTIVGENEVKIDIGSRNAIRDVLNALIERYPKLRAKLLDRNGSLSGRVNVFVNGTSVRGVRGIDTVLQEDDKIFLVSALGGG